MSEEALISHFPPALAARVKSAKLKGEAAILVVDANGLSEGERTTLEAEIKQILGEKAGISAIHVAMMADKNTPVIIAVGSGKGGVGKSTLTANLAAALAKMGHKVGIVDADIYGPSQPTLFGTEGIRPDARDNKLVPVMSALGIPMLSMGHLVEAGRALAWRGPMVSNALGQLIDAHWDDISVILVDLPPGTGDIQLSMLQKHKPAGAVLVSTPQDLALIDAQRAANLFETGKVPIIGLVENMAGYSCPHCGEMSDPFGMGGVEAAAKGAGIPFLGRIPLSRAIYAASDEGTPPASQEGMEGEPFTLIAKRLATWLENRASPA